MAESSIGQPVLALERFLPFQLSRLSNRISAAIARTYQTTHGLSVTEWRVTAILGRFPNLSARAVAEKGALDKVAVSRAVKQLEKRGLVTRRTADDDRRRSVLTLSTAGRNMHDQVADVVLNYERILLEILEPREHEQLTMLLDKLWHRAEALG